MAIFRRGPPYNGGVECNVVSLLHLAEGFLLTACIGRPSATCYKQSLSSVTVYSARSTKRGIALYTFTVVREPCVWQQGSTLRRRQLNRIDYCIGKSEEEVTNNKKLRSRYCTIEANYWQARSIARPLRDSRATYNYILSSIPNPNCGKLQKDKVDRPGNAQLFLNR